jgi:hypothetical protein
MVTIATVLRSGGDFEPAHVQAIQRMLVAHSPSLDYRLLVLSDVVVSGVDRVGLEYGWPGWWSKVEVCRPDVVGPVFYMDLDSVIVGDVAPLVSDVACSHAIRDFWIPSSLQTGVMLLTDEDRALVWSLWMADPSRWLGSWTQGTDVVGGGGARPHTVSSVFREVLADRACFYQDTHPDMVVSYKAHLRGRHSAPPAGVSLVCFHGKPRPWDCDEEWARGWYA